MDDPILLKQQIEFLQLELDDLRCREIQTKSMYESMLKSFSSSSSQSTSQEDVKVLKENQAQEIRMLDSKHRQQIQSYERKLEDFSNQQLDHEENLKRLQSRHEESLNSFKFEILKLQEEKSRLEYQLTQKEAAEKTIEKLNAEKSKLKNLIDEQKFSYDEEIMHIRENCNKNLEDLRKIYDSEKTGLQKIIDDQFTKISKLSQGYLADELEEILNSTGSKLDELQNSQSLALEACKSLKAYLNSGDKPDKDSLSNCAGLVNLIKILENNEKKLKDLVKQKDSQIQGLHKQDNYNADLLAERDSEILKLKKMIGDLRVEAEGSSKPPVHTPKSKHGRSRTALQPTENSPGLQTRDIENSDDKPRKSDKLGSPVGVECDICKYYVSSSKLLEHMISCKLEYELRSPSNYSTFSTSEQRYSMEKTENLDKKVNELKLAVGKLKNQRDRARVAGEHLLLHLKNAKLELAVSEERACELQMDLKKEIKVLVKHVLGIRSRYPLPLEAIAEIDRMVNKSSRFFGGKMQFPVDE